MEALLRQSAFYQPFPNYLFHKVDVVHLYRPKNKKVVFLLFHEEIL